jgi:DNA mismatch endonuclease, patch repair protein
LVDKISPEKRSAIMRRVRREGTEPELTLRRMLHAMGYRFRLHAKELPGSPDVVFRPRKAAVFMHGCFWHGHQCRWGRPVKSNAEYWAAKIARNQRRDAASVDALAENGWRTLVVWECELKDVDTLSARLRDFLGLQRPKATGDEDHIFR